MAAEFSEAQMAAIQQMISAAVAAASEGQQQPAATTPVSTVPSPVPMAPGAPGELGNARMMQTVAKHSLRV